MAGETILVVDDGQENRDFIVEYILKPNQYRALLARDGHEGLRQAFQHEPDLILLDYQMPKMDGRGVLEALAERGMEIPVVLMTFYGSEEIAIETFRLGVRDYVKKPYSVDEMLRVIERNLSESRLRKEKDALLDRLVQANRELQRRVNELNALYSVGKNVTATMSMPQLLPKITDAAVQVTQADEGRLYLIEGDKLICRAEKHAQHARSAAVERETNNQALDYVVTSGKEMVIAHGQDAHQQSPHTSAALAPLVLRGEVIGVLEVNNQPENPRQFTRNDASLLSALTDYAAIAVENSRNMDALRQQEAQEKAQIRGTFERFVPPTVVQRALARPDELELGGTRQEVTILFADIRGYTAWSEKESPERVVEMLNDYLSLAAELVLAWEGTLDKFFGDGLMAIFNAPEPQQHHVHRATDTALALLRAADDLNQRKSYGLSYSIGLNVGEAVVGYIGTQRAMNYTAIGDVVNLAKRLQERAAPGQILVEQSMINQLENRAHGRKLGELKVRHRQTPAIVYELTDLDPLP